MEFIDNITPSWTSYQSAVNPGFYIGASKDIDAYNTWLSAYLPNAYQAALLNYQNEYDKPVNQMLRYQQAGLNQYAFQPSQSSLGSQGAAPKVSTSRQELRNQKINQVLSAVSSVSQAVGAAKEIFDYMNFGRHASEYNMQTAHSRMLQTQNEAAWSNYWNRGYDPGSWFEFDDNGNLLAEHFIKDSPRAQYMQFSTQRIQAQISQLQSIVGVLYPSQVEANKARAALQAYQKSLLEGQNQAVLDINTGNELADSILKMLAFWIKNSLSLGSISQMM